MYWFGGTMRRKIYLGILSLCIGLLWGKASVFAAEMPKSQSVKVGWFESAGYFEKDRKNNLNGFGVDYLNAIADYTGWEYEFVEGTREECLTMLQNGEIDIMSPVRVDLELENVQISEEIIGESFGYIYKLENNFNISYEEYSKFNQMIIGIEKGSGIEKEVLAYCEKYNFQFFDIIYYDTMDEMQKELAERKIDAIAVDSYVSIDNLKVVGRFTNSMVAFAVSDEALLAPLNQAVEKIKLELPEFEEDLKQRYFSESSQTELEYSAEEKTFLTAGKKYNVVLTEEQYPISYRSTEEMGQKGIVVDVLKQLEHYSGITFNITYVDSHARAEQMLKSGEADIFGGDIVVKNNVNSLVDASEAEDGSGRKEYTAEYYDMEMSFVGRKGTDMDAHLRIAVPTYVKKCIPELEIIYPKYQFIIYDSDEECLNSILNKNVDAAVQSDLKINEITIYDKYKELQNLKFIQGNYAASFTIFTTDDILVNILNKTLNHISESAMATIENNNIQHIAMEQITLWEFVQRYWGYFILAFVLLVLVNGVTIGYRKYKREKKEKEKAYRDNIADVSSMQKFRIDVEPILSSDLKLDYFILSIDIEQFKIVNDLYGYKEGDKVISYLGSVLKNSLDQESYITRSNADCFVIMKKAGGFEEIVSYLKTVFDKIEMDILQFDAEYKLILKAGVYEIVEDDFLLSSMIDKANIAKSNMEVGHESMYALYSEEMRQNAIEEKKMENDMERALETGQFRVYLQPQVDLKTRKIVSAEALVRWKNPERGMIDPIKFIPLFEKNGFICKLDYYVWEEAIKTLAKWRDNNQPMVPISINLSSADIRKKGMLEKTIELLDKYNIPSKWVKAELTESMCLENDKLVMEKMALLKSKGIKIAIDDFGSGYSSLHMLKEMPIDILKIDKSFLTYEREMQEKDEILIRDVIELGKHLRMVIITEGVENLEQSDFLEEIGCDIVQGYYYGRPMPIENFERLIEENYKEEA